jgi:hypothetical protein
MRADKKESGQINRRRLLTGAGLAVGAAAAATAAGACEQDKVTSKKDDSKQQHAGYRESESVKTYYKLARF